MKTIEISGKREILLVDTEADTVEEMRSLEAMYNKKFLCKLSEIAAADAAELVDSIEQNGFKAEYKNYSDKYYANGWFLFAKNSFYSLIESAGVLFENPYRDGVPRFMHLSEHECLEEYNKQETNVFRPESTLVFVKE